MSLPDKRRIRLTDNDKHFGPITIGEKHLDWKPIGIVLDSGDEDDNWGCSLKLYLRGRTVRINLPRIIKPWRQWVDTSKYSWSENPRGGYWDVHAREYGFRVSDGFLQVFLGPQTHDSTTTKSWSAHLPWTQWRHIRKSLYDTNGKHFWTEWDRPRRFPFRDEWEARQAVVTACPKVVFEFDDYDGQLIQATTHIEEREWRFGEGWFKWLSLFRKPKIRRSLDLEFSAEVGPEKGSWKGGTLGHGIEMLPNETHEQAFRRYCDQVHRSKHRPYRIKFVGTVIQAKQPSSDAEVAHATSSV